MRRFTTFLAGALSIAMTTAAAPADNYVTMASGLQYHDEVVGIGPEPQAGPTVNSSDSQLSQQSRAAALDR